MTKIDNRKFDIGDKVQADIDGTITKGVVYGVQYNDGDGDESTTEDRQNFRYLVEIDKEPSGQADEKGKEIMRPVTITVEEDDIQA